MPRETTFGLSVGAYLAKPPCHPGQLLLILVESPVTDPLPVGVKLLKG